MTTALIVSANYYFFKMESTATKPKLRGDVLITECVRATVLLPSQIKDSSLCWRVFIAEPPKGFQELRQNIIKAKQ